MTIQPLKTLHKKIKQLKHHARQHTAGQYTIVSLIMTIVLIILYTRMYPIMKDYINDITPQMNTLDAAVLSLIPFFILLAILLNILWYVIPRRR